MPCPLTLRAPGPGPGPGSGPRPWRLIPAPRAVLTTFTAVALAGAALLAGASTAAASPLQPAGKGVNLEHAAAATGCRAPASTPATATPVPGVPSDWNLVSFDGTVIRLHWFPAPGAGAGHPDPTILMGPGWGLSGDTDTTSSSSGLFGVLTIRQLWDNGFNVLTWDPRGFGDSGGAAEIDSAATEGRDMERMISWVATRPGVELDRPGVPRIGMVGVSYGGGIQLTTAALSCAVAAIVPEWAWHSLVSSLDQGGLTKNGWSNILYSAVVGRPVDPHITSAHLQSLATGVLSPSNVAWFASRGPGALVEGIRVPTLLVQGEEDDLFPLSEATANYAILHRDGVPVSMTWMCGGHGVCLTPPGNADFVADQTLAWLDRYVKGESGVGTGPPFHFVDQKGVGYSASEYPLPVARTMAASGHGTLTLVAGGGSGPAHPPATSTDVLAGIAGPVTPAEAAHALNVPIAVGRQPGLVVGAPRLTLTYHGTSPPGARPTAVFAQIVDDATGIVLGNQITTIPVVLDGKEHTTTVPLQIVVYHGLPGDRLTLQLVATTVAFAQPRLGGVVHFDDVQVSLPVVSGYQG